MLQTCLDCRRQLWREACHSGGCYWGGWRLGDDDGVRDGQEGRCSKNRRCNRETFKPQTRVSSEELFRSTGSETNLGTDEMSVERPRKWLNRGRWCSTEAWVETKEVKFTVRVVIKNEGGYKNCSELMTWEGLWTSRLLSSP